MSASDWIVYMNAREELTGSYLDRGIWGGNFSSKNTVRCS